MRIRKQDENGDYVFGRGASDFYVNVPDAVRLACVYRLQMNLGEWWLDLSSGTPWGTKVIGRQTESTRDPVVRSRVLGTPNVIALTNYSSTLDRDTRKWSVSGMVTTKFSTSPIALNALTFGGP